MTITDTKTTSKRSRKMAREPLLEATSDSVATDREGAIKIGAPAKRPSKIGLVLALLARNEGATIEQLVAATGWLPHTTRAALTGLKKKGHAITNEKVEGIGRVYRLAAV